MITAPGNRVARSGRRWRCLLGLGLTAALALAASQLPVRDWLREALAIITGLGWWGPVLFIGLYVLATVLFLPGSVLTLGAGAAFGVAWGCVYVSLGATLGATASFLLGRYLARETVARQMAGNARFAAIDRAVAKEGWKIVGLTRLSPAFPFNLLNYAFGLTQVRFTHYVLASWLGMMPGTVLYVYLGSLARAATGERSRSAGEWILYGVGLLATIAVTVIITRIAGRALARRAAGPSEPGHHG
jgi:uncharacterized membrane protein YdjX (TVP38/TMEM64 family)